MDRSPAERRCTRLGTGEFRAAPQEFCGPAVAEDPEVLPVNSGSALAPHDPGRATCSVCRAPIAPLCHELLRMYSRPRLGGVQPCSTRDVLRTHDRLLS